jgi:copper transport protein
MTTRGRIVVALAAVVVCLAAPSFASAHAYLTKTVPAASVVLDTPPPNVELTYDEAVEPRFAIVSVTDAAGHQQTTGPPQRSPANPDTLVVPLRPNLAEGWYLVYWRAISVDGHPVSGAFTFAVGPNPGPAPQFPVPKISATAVTAPLLIARWVMFLSVMSAIGLLVFRLLIARPLLRRRPGTSLRAVSIAFVTASVVGVLTIPVYLDVSTANDSLRSVFDVGALVPLFRVTAFGRGYVDMTVCFALFAVAGWIALWVDRSDRERRSIAELVATTGALLAAAAVLVIPGTAGHAAQTSPRGLSVVLDWLHLITGSLWLGGLVGLLIVTASLGAANRVAGLAIVVPRFSRVAFVSVFLLLGTGTWATINHMPALSALWETGYGVAILVKIGLLLCAMVLASINLLRTKPQLEAAADDPSGGAGAARALRRLVGAEAVLVIGAIFAATVLSSLAPPPPAFALQDKALATVGPGKVVKTVKQDGYELQVLLTPNKAAAPNSFALKITKDGKPVTGADVALTFNHTEMEMPQQDYQLQEIRPGVYSRAAPALVMVGKWALDYQIAPKGGQPFNALILDQADG